MIKILLPFMIIWPLCSLVCLHTAYAVEINPTLPAENIDLISTVDQITVGGNYSGSNLYIAGVIENTDPLLWRQNRYNVIVVLEGPNREFIMREKKRKLGVWINADALTFNRVPLFYAVATSRPLQDITNSDTYRELGLGLNYVHLRIMTEQPQMKELFREKLIEIKKKQKLYSENIGAVVFAKGSLFKVQFSLPANVPVGAYRVHAYLFKDSAFIKEASTDLTIAKAHLAFNIYQAAHLNGLWYGISAVLLAVATSLIGRLIIKKD